MKKQILISTTIGIAIWGGTALMVMNTANAENTSTTSEALIAATNNTLNASPILNNSKNETVYVLADPSGNATSKFIGSNLYSGTEELPFALKISYFLDGQEISARDLKGKSGHVKIVYTYTSTAKYFDKNIPFVALTGLTLNHDNFSNVKLTNGKIITETSNSYIITGYAITGLNTNLGTDILPESFTIEADTKDFKLNDGYTIFTNELLADINTSKLSTIDSLTNSIYQLSDALDQIIAGSAELSNGLTTALTGTKTLYEGSQTLASGTKEALAGATELRDGLNGAVSQYNESLQTGANTVIQNAINTLRADLPDITINNYQNIIDATATNLTTYLGTLTPGTEAFAETYDKIVNLRTAKSMIDFGLGVIGYTNGIADAANGASTLVDGLTKLSAGANTISSGLGSLVDGTTKLYQGSITLKDGLTTFKISGIDKLVDFASKDLSNFVSNLRSSVSAANIYHSFGNVNANSVKFIVKTPSI